VAIYTRQSVADDLEFNSLEAQRQAIEVYALSQKSQGWEVLPERYDDHGFSGGTIERPAFKHLLKDVEAGKIDVVAVHRLDRLSRSINDFVRVMEFLDAVGKGKASPAILQRLGELDLAIQALETPVATLNEELKRITFRGDPRGGARRSP
jgi:DNA invertase Pin-like site-specific DNA recombinase